MKILVLAGYTQSLLSRKGLLEQMIRKGHCVVASAPEPDEDQILDQIGGVFIPLYFNRTQTNPFADFKQITAYRKLIKQVKPDTVFCYSIKPNIYGVIAAHGRVKNIYTMFTGLGNVFTQGGGVKRVIVRWIAKLLLTYSLSKCKTTIFQNPDDRWEFISTGLVKEKKTALVDGSGVDMAHFTPTPLPEKPVFLMVSRLLREKGVTEYLQAARMVKRKHSKARMLLLGPYEKNGFALREEDIRPYVEDGSVEYMGEVKDVRPYYDMASVVVLPSYREGTPRTMLEAMACGRAIITTDVPGCRETVLHEKNGLIVPVKDVDALAEAMLWMMEHPEQIEGMGQEGLNYCKDRYAVETVIGEMLAVLGL